MHFKKSALASETMLRTQRSRRFPKPEKSVIFGILNGTVGKIVGKLKF